MRDKLRSVSLYYYATISAGLLILLTITVVKIFAASHPLRYPFLALLCIGFGPGYLRYQIRVRRQTDQANTGTRRYALLLILIAAYMGFRYLARNLARHEMAGEDYGVAMGFFILGLFLAYYGLYTLYLWKNRHTMTAETGRSSES